MQEAKTHPQDDSTHEEKPATGAYSGDVGSAGHTVAIYVSDHCVNCRYALEIAALIRAEYPHIQLKVIDLAAPEDAVPESVFATPTYLLDGRVWSLGNPSPQQVRDKLSRLE